jgi:hypothetical protein
MSTPWLAQLSPSPFPTQGGLTPSQEGYPDEIYGLPTVFVVLACVAFVVFAIYFLRCEKRRERAQWRADDWDRPFPRYPLIPLRPRKGEARPSSE